MLQTTTWIEPGTASICLYCSTLLIRGRAGARMLSRHLKHDKEAVTDVAVDEFGDFICDHPDILVTLLFVSGSLLTGSNGAELSSIVSRAPELVKSTRTLVRSTSKSLTTRVNSLIRSTRGLARSNSKYRVPGLSRVFVGGELSRHEPDTAVSIP